VVPGVLEAYIMRLGRWLCHMLQYSRVGSTQRHLSHNRVVVMLLDGVWLYYGG
jgi:hypothetical protein